MIARRAALLGLAAAAIPCAMASHARAREGWTTYRNERFGTTIEHPARFRPGQPPVNGDGQRFTDPDGATLSVWGSLNVEDRDIAALEAFLRAHAPAGERITYRAAGRAWLVLSGTRGGHIFYRRYALSHGNEIVDAFELSYPAALAARYDPMAARMSRSLRSGRGYQTP